jgi:hypothetical protein
MDFSSVSFLAGSTSLAYVQSNWAGERALSPARGVRLLIRAEFTKIDALAGD